MVDPSEVFSSRKEGIQHPHQDFPTHYLHLNFNNGQPNLYTSFPDFKGPIFTSEFGIWLAQSMGVDVIHSSLFAGDLSYEQETQPLIRKYLSFPSSKRHCYSYSSTKLEEPKGMKMIPLEIGNKEKVKVYYESAFKAFQQLNCRQVAKAYIKLIEPRKHVRYPYNGGKGAFGEKGDPEKTKPDWWPDNVTHREPDHLKKPERIRLLVHIFHQLGNITTDELEEAGCGAQREIKPRERLDILDEIYKVRRAEESYKRGEIDVVYITNRNTKQVSQAAENADCLNIHGLEKPIETQDIRHRMPSPLPPIISYVPVNQARQGFTIPSANEHQSIRKQEFPRFPSYSSFEGLDYTQQWLPNTANETAIPGTLPHTYPELNSTRKDFNNIPMDGFAREEQILYRGC
ncbi:hypothetical protein TESG_00542 [Trichophyton tonsurans CBS 112818]|uniref:Subtelomeric hrmA-associated cluster protein AFUB-079030/YDR124W-like helical bundle domain-containing protein n=1 Tax=Trichophyton tonsurans (strain CBS 112818) TaxID=647933 RepID=F2RNS4_TRIT1|nr:hypothetical protein TESG_00542 [Trichophyton tonsurans CBS 112818]